MTPVPDDEPGGAPLVVALRIVDPSMRLRAIRAFADVPQVIVVDDEGEADLTLSDAAPNDVRSSGAFEAADGREFDVLSERESEVLDLLSTGASNKAIARALGISVHTAKFHVTSIMTKLGATSRTDAVARAMRRGLVLI